MISKKENWTLPNHLVHLLINILKCHDDMCLTPIQILRLLFYDPLFCCRHGNSGNSSLLRQVLSLLSKDTDISRQILLPDISPSWTYIIAFPPPLCLFYNLLSKGCQWRSLRGSFVGAKFGWNAVLWRCLVVTGRAFVQCTLSLVILPHPMICSTLI